MWNQRFTLLGITQCMQGVATKFATLKKRLDAVSDSAKLGLSATIS